MISIFTNPTLKQRSRFKETAKKLIGRKANTIQAGLYGGHPAVTRSLCEGLDNLGIAYNYNPGVNDVCETAVVLHGIDALLQAIELKKKGTIKTLVAGPNLVILPTDYNAVIASEEIDLCIAPSQWVCDNYIYLKNELKERCLPWPAGINMANWDIPVAKPMPKRILFYNKRAPFKLFDKCVNITRDLGYEVDIITYGKYNLDDYKRYLNDCFLLVHFVEQESQGISLLEAWAANVPTLVWNPGFFLWENKNFECSSSPYLTEQTGCFFYDDTAYRKVLSDITFPDHRFTPRRWVAKNMTDTISAQRLLNLIYAQQNKTTV